MDRNNMIIDFDRIKSCGLKLNRAKCVLGVKQFKYVEHIFSQEGLQVDLSKIAWPEMTDIIYILVKLCGNTT